MEEYNYVDQRLHLLSQVIAKANRTYVPKQSDDSHTNLYYDSIGDRIIGRWIHTPKTRLLFGLNLSSLSFFVLCKDLSKTLTISSVGKTILQIESEIEKALGSIDLNPTGFCRDLHFNIPDYPFSKSTVEALSSKDVRTWKHYRALANHLCNDLICHIQQPIEARIWPHHFDTGVYFELPTHPGIGFGLAMKDDMVGAPYFYMAGYPRAGKIRYENLPKLIYGNWLVTSHWKGAVLPLTDMQAMTAAQKHSNTRKFIKTTLDWFLGDVQTNV